MLNVYHRGKLQGEHQVAKSNTHPTEWQLWSARAGSAFQAYSLDCITIYITGSANHLLIKFPENWFPENCKNLKLILKSRPREGRGLKSAAGPAHSKVL